MGPAPEALVWVFRSTSVVDNDNHDGDEPQLSREVSSAWYDNCGPILVCHEGNASRAKDGHDYLQWVASTLTGDLLVFHVKPPCPKIAKCHGCAAGRSVLTVEAPGEKIRIWLDTQLVRDASSSPGPMSVWKSRDWIPSRSQ